MSLWRNGMGKPRLVDSNRSKSRRREQVLRFACESLERRTLLATITFSNPAGGDWSDPTNWTPQVVPGVNDTAVINFANQQIIVSYNDMSGPLLLNNLVNNDLLEIGGGGVTWTAGTWDGSGTVEILAPMTISGSANKILKDGQSIVNLDTTTLSGTGNIVGQVGASIINEGTFNATSDADITYPTGTGQGIFENGGIFIKTGDGTTTEIGGPQGFRFENSENDVANPDVNAIFGDCQIQSGTLELGDDQNVADTYGGTFEISANATLDYDRGQHNIVVLRPPMGAPEVVPSITGAGTLEVSGGTVQFYGTLAVHEIDVSGGSLLLQQNMTEFGGAPQKNTTPTKTVAGTVDILNFTGGILGGNGGGIFPVTPQPDVFKNMELPALIVGTTFNWTGGTLSGSGQLANFAATSTISGANPKAVVGGFALDIFDQTVWTDSGTITMNGNSVIFIHFDGTLWDQNDGTIMQGNVDSNGGSIWNSGILLKDDGTGTTTIGAGINFINDENPANFVTTQIPIAGPAVGMYYEETLTGVGLAAKLNIVTGTVSLQGTSLNRNNYLISPGATLSIDGGVQQNQSYTVGNNGTFNASILGDDGGNINFGNASFVNDNLSIIDVTNATFGSGTYTFNNTAPGALLVQNAVFNGGLTGTITGAGALEVGTSFIWNSGAFTGVGPANTTSNLEIDAGATLTIPSGDRSTTNSYNIQNRGTIQWTTAAGTLTVNGSYTQTSTGTFISTASASTQTINHLLVFGNVAIDGILTLNLGALTPTNGQVITVIDNRSTNPLGGAGQFVGLPEGTTLTFGDVAYTLSYVGGNGNDVVLTATIIPTVTIANPTPILEGNSGTTNLNFTVSLSQATTLNVSVHYATAGGTATSGIDFQSTSGILTIPAGQTSGTIAVPIIGDILPEANETFALAISNPQHAFLGTPSVATGKILDDDAPPQISFDQATYTANETDGSVVVTVSRTNPTIAVTVHYATSNGTAIAGTDYTATSGILSMPIGVASADITIPIINQGLFSGSKTFNVTLSSPQGGAATLVAPSTTEVEISDNAAPPPNISINGASASEPIYGNINAVFTATLSAPLPTQVTVQYNTADGTAVAGSDYTATSGTLTFAPNQTTAQITVPVNFDFVQESTETFSVLLSNPSVNAILGTSSGTGTILNQPVHTASFDAQNSYKYVDSAANPATIILRGPGNGTLLYLGLTNNDSKEIILDNTTPQTQLIIRTAQPNTYLVNVIINGSIRAITGPALNLLGSLTVSGAMQTLRLNSLFGGNTISIGAGDGAFKAITATFNNVTGTTLNSALPITTLKVNNWLDSSDGVDITAPSIGSIVSSGEFQADITLPGSLGTFRAGGPLDDAIFRIGGNINTLAATQITDSSIFAGVLSSLTTLPTSPSQFSSSTSTINNVTVTGKTVGAFSNSLIAAPTVGNVQLGSVATSNNGTQFGVVGNVIRSVRGKNHEIINLNGNTLPGNPFSDVDLVVRLTTSINP